MRPWKQTPHVRSPAGYQSRLECVSLYHKNWSELWQLSVGTPPLIDFTGRILKNSSWPTGSDGPEEPRVWHRVARNRATDFSAFLVALQFCFVFLPYLCLMFVFGEIHITALPRLSLCVRDSFLLSGTFSFLDLPEHSSRGRLWGWLMMTSTWLGKSPAFKRVLITSTIHRRPLLTSSLTSCWILALSGLSHGWQWW